MIMPNAGLVPHEQHLNALLDKEGALIDQVMCVFHPTPRSYTGEDLVEISCHGNPLIVQKIMDSIESTGLVRKAQPGEFTKRAFLNGKIDLLQAEAVGALIGAGTPVGYELAKSLAAGELSRRFVPMKNLLAEALTSLEASFITEDAPFSPEVLTTDLSRLTDELREMIASSREATVLSRGIITTIAGLPNAGKSSLFNALLGYPRAIVHEEEGTTRDTLTEHLICGDLEFIFHDTAGIRETPSGPERLGVERTLEALESSDLVLYVVDARSGLQPHEKTWLPLGKKTILVMNKMDLLEEIPPVGGEEIFPVVFISAKYATGIDSLLKIMEQIFPEARPEVFLERHLGLLGRVLRSLETGIDGLQAGVTPDVITIDLQDAYSALKELTGEEISPDILDLVFSDFCVGK